MSISVISWIPPPTRRSIARTTLVRKVFPSWPSSFDQPCLQQDTSNYGAFPVSVQIRMNPYLKPSCLVSCLPRCTLMKECHRMYGIVICEVFRISPILVTVTLRSLNLCRGPRGHSELTYRTYTLTYKHTRHTSAGVVQLR